MSQVLGWLGRRLGVLVLLAIPALGAAGAGAQPPGINALTPEEKAQGWTLLFTGTDLSGWTTSGDPEAWAAREGELVVVKPGAGWWLRTERMYRDFELALDFLVPANGNSGVGLRGSSGGDPAFTGMEVQIFDSHGKPPADNQAGAVYNAIAPESQAVRPAGEWNTYRIRLVGDTLDVWLNGQHVQRAQKLDDRGYVHKPENRSPLRDRLTTGFISLQDHGDAVRFRNLKIRDLSPDPDSGGWRPLIGKDLAGWTKRGAGEWKVEEATGTLVGSDGPGHLYTTETFTDLELRALVRVNAKGNSGIYVRATPPRDNPDTWPVGYEAQIDNHDPKNFTGVVYGRAYPAGITAPLTRDEAWFDYRVLAMGDTVRTWINGVPMVDATLTELADGHVALQAHHAGNRIEYRDLAVRPPRGAPDRPNAGAARHAPRAAGDPVRALYCTQALGYAHEVLPESRNILADVARRLDWLEVEHVDDLAEVTPERLARTDVLILFTTGAVPIDTRMLEGWVASGGAVVGVHSATDTLADDRAYVRLIGGTFDGHPWNQKVRIIASPRSPITAPLLDESGEGTDPASGGRGFLITDEIYQFREIAPDNQVLMHLDPQTPGAQPGRDYPLAWTRQVGAGRVFYTALGHRPEVWRDRRFVAHLVEGIRWAAREP
ncbi:MAG TPA: family 16 glycoside hydrolase [Phycisphaerales bacterium]|nr:family 16 glycoside hydrolase [Phycisphaerales bacterium]